MWDEDIRTRKPEAVKKYQELCQDEILFYEFLQYEFQEQWAQLKCYANEQGVKIIGDIPIYVAMDSADSWAHPELFQFSAVMRWNPLYQMLQCFREIVLYGVFPTWRRHLICILFAVGALCLGVYVFRKKQKNLILYL